MGSGDANPATIDATKLQALRKRINELDRIKKLAWGHPDAAIWFDD